MNRLILIFILAVASVAGRSQQTPNYCGQVEAREKLFARFPQCVEQVLASDEQLERETAEAEAQRGGGNQVFIIPVVFHIIHNYGPENISDEQVLNALDILNRDYRKLNADIEDVVTEFQGITADIEIEFRIAGYDPDGNCTNGITRTVSDLTYAGDDNMKSLIHWPRNSYMNVWVCADAAGAAGYTNLPADVNNAWAASEDGIVIRHDYLGNIGTSSEGHSRVLTHEVGHWLNLLHCWGSSNNPGLASNCQMDDNVSDTPNSIGWTSCDLDGTSCNVVINNVQNYMEYSYCCRMFTQGQRTRMRTAIQSSVAQRNQLWTQANLAETGVLEPVLCSANFAVNKPSVCQGETVQFDDLSYNGVTTWTWNFGDGVTLTGDDPAVYQNPSHTYDSAGDYTVTLEVGNGNETISVTKTNFISVIGEGQIGIPYSEGFETGWPNSNWHVNNVNNDDTWQVVTSAAYTGTHSLKLANNNNDLLDNTDEIISATFNASGMDTVFLQYKWAFATRLDETDDRLRVSVSGDCGTTWYLKKVHKGLTDLPSAPSTNQAFVPSGTDQWLEKTLTLDDQSWFTDNFRVKFEFVAKGGNNIYLDDINISGVDSAGNVISAVPLFTWAPALSVYPNPASEDAICRLEMLRDQNVVIDLYNSMGQICDQLYSGTLTSGAHEFRIPAQARGLYTVVVHTGVTHLSRKLIFG